MISKILSIFVIFPLIGFGQLKNTSEIKPTYSISTGVEIINYGNSTFVSSYINPEVSFKLMPKINLNTGFIIGNFNKMGIENASDKNFSPFYPQTFSNSFYVQGEYMYSEKLSITGSVYLPLQENINEMNPQIKTANYKNYRIGVEYKIADGIQINAEFGKSNLPFNNPYSNPFGSFPMRSNSMLFY